MDSSLGVPLDIGTTLPNADTVKRNKNVATKSICFEAVKSGGVGKGQNGAVY